MTSEERDSIRSINALMAAAHEDAIHASVSPDLDRAHSLSARAAHTLANARQIAIYMQENDALQDDGKVTT